MLLARSGIAERSEESRELQANRGEIDGLPCDAVERIGQRPH